LDRNIRVIKTLVFVTVAAYFTYALYWFSKSLLWIAEISLKPENYSPPTGFRFINSYSISSAFLMEYSGFLGLMIRVVGASYALLSAFLILKTKSNSFQTVRNKIANAILLEGLYFLSFIPAIYFLLNYSGLPSTSNLLLSTGLSAQILLISPFFIGLSFKVRKYDPGADGSSILRLAGLASMSYVIALWITYISKWAEMTAVESINWLLTFPRNMGFLNTITNLSLAVVFAVMGVHHVLRKRDVTKTARLWGLASIFLSTHIIIYVLYCANFGVLNFIQFGELWTIPLLGVGIYLVLKKPTAPRETQKTFP